MTITNTLQFRDSVEKSKIQQSSNELDFLQRSKEDIKARRAQLEEVGEGFEKIFLNKLLDSMRQTVNKKDDPFYGGFSQEVFEDMLYDKYADIMSKTNYLGMAELIVAQYEKYL